MSFNLPKFLRRTPTESLRTYFDERRLEPLAEIQREASGRELIEDLRAAIERLPDSERERIYNDFERVSQLTDDIGQLALRAMLNDAPDLLAALSEIDSHEGRALLVLLRQPKEFDRALSAAYADRLLNGRYWNRFRVRGAPPDAGVPLGERFSEEVRNLFGAFDGSGRRICIDHFERPGAGPFGSPHDRLVQYTIYVEKLPESSLEYGEDGPARRTYRPAREAALCLDCGSGILDVMSEGGKSLRENIAHVFARFALGDEAGVELVRRRDFHLDRLKRPIPFPTDAPDGVKSVMVTRLGLAPANESYGRVMVEVGKATTETIHAASERWFGFAEPIGRVEWRIVQATLRIVFHPEPDGGREKIVNVNLRMPNGSDLRNQTFRHRLVSEKYLVRWGLTAPA